MTKTRKIISAVMSGILALMMTLNAAAMETGELPADPGPITDGEASLASAELVSEIEHLRGANERHFQASDGSYVAVSYAEQIHYQDEDGNWLEVDNTLAAETDDAGKTVYKNRDGLFDVEFAEPGDASRDTVKIKSEDYELSWKVFAASAPVTPAPQPGAAVMSQEETDLLAEQEADVLTGMQATAQMSLPAADISALSNEEKLMAAEKSASRVIYGDALGADTDVIYDVSGNRVKESILLDAYTGNYGYVTQISAPDLSAVLNEDGSVTFANEAGEKVFAVEAPYMFDDTGVHSYDIAVALKETAEGYALIYVPNDAWLADPQRAYPVVIDPTVAVYNTVTHEIDCEDDTLSWNGGNVYGIDSTGTTLTVGHSNGQYRFTLIDYDNLPTLPNNCTIENIKQVMTVYSHNAISTISSYPLYHEYETGYISIYGLASCYNPDKKVNATASQSNGYAFVTFTYSGANINKFGTYDPTTGKIYCNGFLIADPRHEEWQSSTSYYGQYVSLYSSNNSGTASGILPMSPRPYVSIQYTRNEPPEGVYRIGNSGVPVGQYIDYWFFEKVDNPTTTLSVDENSYGPYYIRYYDRYNQYSSALNGAPVYMGHSGNSMTNMEVNSAVATPNSNYYWYIRLCSNNTVDIYYIVGGVEKRWSVSNSYSSVSYTNIYDSLILQDASSSNSRQKWTMSISSTSTTFRWPLAYAEYEKDDKLIRNTYQIYSTWGYRNKFKEHHYGIDIRTNLIDSSSNRNVYAAADGIVFKVGTRYGIKYVTIIHRSMLSGEFYYNTEYLHLSSYCVTEGQFVKQGEKIGVSGETGAAGQPHLHFQVEKDFSIASADEANNIGQWLIDNGTDINPLSKYHKDDSRATDSNPNPIFLANYNAPKDTGDEVEGEYIGVNPDFIFNFNESDYWEHDS